MVKAVDHDLGSSTSTVAWEGAKGAAKGGILPIIVGAVTIGLLTYGAAAGIAAIGANGGGLLAWMGSHIPATIGIIGATIGAGLAAAYAGIGAAIGAVFGLAKGSSRVGAERAKFEERSGTRDMALQAKMQQVQMSGAQMGYERGVRDAQVAMAQRIQEMQMAQINEQMAAAAEKNSAPCTKHVDAEMKRREAASVAATQRV